MNYIGSKLSLLKFIEESITKVVHENCYQFCDLFAGTGIVGLHFKKKGFKIISNDIQYYSYVINQQLIGNHQELIFANLISKIPILQQSEIKDRKIIVLNYLNNMNGLEGFITKNYSTENNILQTNKRLYWTTENAMRCDAIRIEIETWKNNSLINEKEYFYLLATLIEAVDKVANTASVYGAYLKKIKKSALNPLKLIPQNLYFNDYEHEIFNENANDLISKIQTDILYLDPPYNRRQYATNYHLLETIAKYDNPEINGITGLRNYENQKSKYCSKKEVLKSFEDLIMKAKAKYIFLSYNNEGLMTEAEVKTVMLKRGEYGIFKKIYNRFKADTDENRNHIANNTTEYLHYVICDK